MRRTTIYDIVLLWLLFFGVWPFADPGHAADTIGSAIDIGIHAVALLLLLMRWQIVIVRRIR